LVSRTAIAASALAIFALVLRLWGLEQGAPDFYGHVDEIGVAASIWNFFRAGTLRPTEFTYPAFYSYLVGAGIWLTALVGATGEGDLGLLDAIVFESFTNPAQVALVGRVISAGLSAGSVALVYRLGREAVSGRVGLLAALFACFSLVPVTRAHMALPDSAMAFWSMLCYYWSWRIYRSGQWKSYVAAGLAAGLVVSTKYNGSFAALAIVAAHLAGGRERHRGLLSLVRDPRLWVAVAVSAIALVAGSPYLLLAHSDYAAIARYQVSSLGFTLSHTSPWWWVIHDLVSVELLVGTAMWVGVLWAAVRRDVLDWMLMAVLIPSFLYIGSWTRESLHYLLHLYPLLALAAARLVDGGGRRSVRGTHPRGQLACTVATTALMLAPSAMQVIRSDAQLVRPDTRALAAAWIEANVSAGTRLGMTWLPYCPRVDLLSARRSVWRYYEGNSVVQERLAARWQQRPAYGLVNLQVTRSRPLVPEAYQGRVDLDDPETRRVFSRGWRTVAELRQRQVEYLVLPEAVYARYLRADPPPSGTAAHHLYWLNRHYFERLIAPQSGLVLVADFPAPDTAVRGGGIRIYRIPRQT